MKKILLILFMSIGILTFAQSKKRSPQINILKVDSPLAVRLIPISNGKDTVVVDSNSTLHIKTDDPPYDKWIAPIIGIIGVIFGFLLSWLKENSFRRSDKKRFIVENLMQHKIKIKRLISEFYPPALDVITGAIKKVVNEDIHGKNTITGKQDRSTEIQEAKKIIHTNMVLFKKLKEDLLEELEHFGIYMSQNICFNEMMDKIRAFDPDTLLDGRKEMEQEDIEKTKAYQVGVFQVEVLERIFRLCELFIFEFENSTRKELKKWIVNIYYSQKQNAFTTINIENPSTSYESQLKKCIWYKPSTWRKI